MPTELPASRRISALPDIFHVVSASPGHLRRGESSVHGVRRLPDITSWNVGGLGTRGPLPPLSLDRNNAYQPARGKQTYSQTRRHHMGRCLMRFTLQNLAENIYNCKSVLTGEEVRILIQWSIILFEKQIFAQLVKKLLAFYSTSPHPHILCS
jgi:hypothetical protein